MRIISGRLRGRELCLPKDEAIRPTIARIKQSIFNIIQFRVTGARFLDLFSGTGSMGIEAISRGAAHTALVDCGKDALLLIDKNLRLTGAEKVGGYSVLRCDYRAAVQRLHGEQFDIIYCDPPYDEDDIYNGLLPLLAPITAEGGVVIVERDRAVESNYAAFTLSDVRRYGAVYVHFFTREAI